MGDARTRQGGPRLTWPRRGLENSLPAAFSPFRATERDEAALAYSAAARRWRTCSPASEQQASDSLSVRRVDALRILAYGETRAPSGVGASGRTTAAVRVKISDPALVDDLVEFLSRSGCIAHAQDETTILVSIPRSLREDAAELELDLYLQVWQATHSEAHANRLQG